MAEGCSTPAARIDIRRKSSCSESICASSDSIRAFTPNTLNGINKNASRYSKTGKARSRNTQPGNQSGKENGRFINMAFIYSLFARNRYGQH